MIGLVCTSLCPMLTIFIQGCGCSSVDRGLGLPIYEAWGSVSSTTSTRCGGTGTESQLFGGRNRVILGYIMGLVPDLPGYSRATLCMCVYSERKE